LTNSLDPLIARKRNGRYISWSLVLRSAVVGKGGYAYGRPLLNIMDEREFLDPFYGRETSETF